MVTFRKVYRDGKVVGTISTNKPGKKGYTYKLKRTKEDRQRTATAKFIKTTSGFKKLKAFITDLTKSGGGITSKGDIYQVIAPGNKNIMEAKGIASDAKTMLPSKNMIRDDFKNLYKPLNVTRQYTPPKALRTDAAYRGSGRANRPVRMSNVVSLEQFVRNNMATATKPMSEKRNKKLTLFPDRKRLSTDAVYNPTAITITEEDRKLLKKLKEMYGN
jgi:hypothetical protein